MKAIPNDNDTHKTNVGEEMSSLKCPKCKGGLLDGDCPSEPRDEDCYYCPTCKREYSNEDLDTSSVAYFALKQYRNRKALTRRFRKVAWGRLYRKAHDRRDLRMFDSDDVCIVMDGSAAIHYKTIEAFIEELEEWEMCEAVVAEDM